MKRQYVGAFIALAIFPILVGCNKPDAASSAKQASDEQLIREFAKANGDDEVKALDYYKHLEVADPTAYRHDMEVRRSAIAMSGWSIDEYADKTIAARQKDDAKAQRMAAMTKSHEAMRTHLKDEYDRKVAAAEKDWNAIGPRGSVADSNAAEKKWNQVKAEESAALDALDKRQEAERREAAAKP